MKRLLILLILISAGTSWAQCTEEAPCPELARLSPAIVGGGVPVAAAGITFVESNVYSSAAASSAPIPNNDYQVGDLVVVVVGWDSTYTISSVSDGTNTWTLQTAQVYWTTLKTQAAWCVIGTAKTAQTITVTMSGAVNDLHATALIFRGSFPADPTDKLVSNSSSSVSTYSTGSSGVFAQAVEAVVVIAHVDGIKTFTEDTTDGFTEVSDQQNSAVQYKIISATTALTCNGSLETGNDYCNAMLVSYKNN